MTINFKALDFETADEAIQRLGHVVRIAKTFSDLAAKPLIQVVLVEAQHRKVEVEHLQIVQLERQQFGVPLGQRVRLVVRPPANAWLMKVWRP